jgi:hypothetical protein
MFDAITRKIDRICAWVKVTVKAWAGDVAQL